MAAIKSHKDLTVWQKSYQLCLLVYRITKHFPKEELYGLTSQMRRAVVSIPFNIAEGYCRQRRLEYIQFLQFSFASAAELETQLLLSNDLGYLYKGEFEEANDLLQEVMKMLNSLIDKIKTSA
jgi:four helix bundle protein